MRTQRASSPQMLALVAQLVSLGSAKTMSLGRGFALPSPGPRPCQHVGLTLTHAAVLLVRAVPAVIEHVAAQGGGEAALVPAQKLLLVFAVGGLGRGRLWRRAGLQVLVFTTLPPLPAGTPPPAQSQVEGPQAWLSSLRGSWLNCSDSQSPLQCLPQGFLSCQVGPPGSRQWILPFP